MIGHRAVSLTCVTQHISTWTMAGHSGARGLGLQAFFRVISSVMSRCNSRPSAQMRGRRDSEKGERHLKGDTEFGNEIRLVPPTIVIRPVVNNLKSTW
eukprot:1747029-Rhodomonas_salina.1